MLTQPVSAIPVRVHMEWWSLVWWDLILQDSKAKIPSLSVVYYSRNTRVDIKTAYRMLHKPNIHPHTATHLYFVKSLVYINWIVLSRWQRLSSTYRLLWQIVNPTISQIGWQIISTNYDEIFSTHRSTASKPNSKFQPLTWWTQINCCNLVSTDQTCLYVN